MEQTQNTFTSGLQMDTHPMQQGNDSLTDALNATFVTMNGNEIVLQNDMGNAKVQNAYLPKGYVPVGMKEYGGVIYVASYNPITDRGQIGSFPSPKRRFGNDYENTGVFNPENFYSGDDIITRSMLIKIGEDKNILRAGDKFLIYSNNLFGDLGDYLTNYNNIEGSYVKTPKNNYFTLYAGILNSRNEFVDITKDLARFSGDKMLSFDDTVSDLYKFNSGYFIAETDNVTNLPKADSDLVEWRQLDELDLNTYKYKLVGPLYLKAELNLPTDFDYSISGISTPNENEYKLTIKTSLTYNCPDGISFTQFDNVKQYFVTDDGKIYKFVRIEESLPYPDYKYVYQRTSNDGVSYSNEIIKLRTDKINANSKIDPIIKYQGRWIHTFLNVTEVFTEVKSDYLTNQDGQIDDGVLGLDVKFSNEDNTRHFDYKDLFTTYDSATNQYHLTAKFDKIQLTTEESIIEYTLTPTIKKWGSTTENLRIVDLQRKGTLDLSKLGSGEMKLISWRFYNNMESKKTSITYGFDAYPEEDHEFRNLKFTFYEITGANSLIINDNGEIIEDEQSQYEMRGTFKVNSELDYNGIRDDVLDWEELKLNPRKMYQVVISWDDYCDEESIKSDYDLRWLLTTQLFNDCYFQNQKNFINDFCNPIDDESDESDEKAVYDSLTGIVPEIIIDKQNVVVEKLSEREDGNKIYKSNYNQDGKWGYNTEYSININSEAIVDWNETNYPDYIYEINHPTITATVKDPTNIDRIEIESEEESEEYLNTNKGKFDLDYTSKAIFKDEATGPLTEGVMNSEYVFERLVDEQNKNCDDQFAFHVGTWDKGGKSTTHYIYTSCTSDDKNFYWRVHKSPGAFMGDHGDGGCYSVTNVVKNKSDGGDHDLTFKTSSDDKDILKLIESSMFEITEDVQHINEYIIKGVTVFKNEKFPSNKGFVITMLRCFNPEHEDEWWWALYDIKPLEGNYSFKAGDDRKNDFSPSLTFESEFYNYVAALSSNTGDQVRIKKFDTTSQQFQKSEFRIEDIEYLVEYKYNNMQLNGVTNNYYTVYKNKNSESQSIFNLSKNSGSYSETYTAQISSSELFQDEVKKLGIISEIKTGSFDNDFNDINGAPLQSDWVYKIVEGGLEPAFQLDKLVRSIYHNEKYIPLFPFKYKKIKDKYNNWTIHRNKDTTLILDRFPVVEGELFGNYQTFE